MGRLEELAYILDSNHPAAVKEREALPAGQWLKMLKEYRQLRKGKRMSILYAEIMELHVDPLFRGAAAAALDLADDLNLGAVTVKWWHELPPGSQIQNVKAVDDRVTGWINRSESDVINVVTDELAGYAHCMAVVLHEARHLWQECNGQFTGYEEGEKDCAEYVFKKTCSPPSQTSVYHVRPGKRGG